MSNPIVRYRRRGWRRKLHVLQARADCPGVRILPDASQYTWSYISLLILLESGLALLEVHLGGLQLEQAIQLRSQMRCQLVPDGLSSVGISLHSQ